MQEDEFWEGKTNPYLKNDGLAIWVGGMREGF
jgi:hypothetical protein